MNILNAKKIYCVGLGGIGVSALAKIFHAQGKEVSGTDSAQSIVTQQLEQLGIAVYKEGKTHLSRDTNFLIYSAAVPKEHPDRAQARAWGIEEIIYPQALAALVEQAETGITVSGTNGKSTTTALIGLMAEASGLDPTVIVGSLLKEWKSNARVGSENITIAEACEHYGHILYFQPDVTVITNIEAEHLDYYRDLKHIQETFEKYINHLPKHGWLILNMDDEISRTKLKRPKTQFMTYGIDHEADVRAKNILQLTHEQSFELWFRKKYIGDIILKIPGKFNISNALAAAAVAIALRFEEGCIKEVLNHFTGIWRRFENLGTWKGATIISDYAHHPSAVALTIQAAKDFFPKQRVVAVFQPHQTHRTKVLFNDFVKALEGADILILTEIYRVQGREENTNFSSERIAKKLLEKGKDVFFAQDLKATEKVLEKIKHDGDVLLLMGAGDIYTLAESLAQGKGK